MISSSGTEFVVVEDSSCLDTNAIILKGTTVLTYKPRFIDRPFSGSLAGIEVGLSNCFSCNLQLWQKYIVFKVLFIQSIEFSFLIVVTSGLLLSIGQRAGNSFVHHRSSQRAGGAVRQPHLSEQLRIAGCL